MAFSVHRLAIDRAVDFAEPFLLRSHDSPPSSAAHPLVQYAKTPSPRTRPIRFRRSQRRQCYVIRYMIISVSADRDTHWKSADRRIHGQRPLLTRTEAA